jgi:hypothetical protein
MLVPCENQKIYFILIFHASFCCCCVSLQNEKEKNVLKRKNIFVVYFFEIKIASPIGSITLCYAK